ncbi:rhomboid family intramembrane serine protease [Chloroflexus sp.]|uniref:rhomboid family intramembrane serine protease n=1 Tax=Chloroflexus sp. TaxID=1904827 RepID=UPI00298EFF69|nr:rhomboid family intramembrane serine protease [Chloroflexus sp.]MCX7860496.1 rhomboid family intramembrane serine protease [Chloroflexus sp.]MDW8406111.1 rhomboid family intramembrane serine protease [Chloroflexus sp.]
MLPLKDTIPSRSFPAVNWALLAANVVVFLLMAGNNRLAEAWINELALVPARLLANPLDPTELLTIFTSMFMHGGWFHLFSNMLALYIFGDNVEDRMGSQRYLIFYLLCGVAAALTHVFFNPASPIPTVGASGALSGVLAAYLLFFPSSRVITLVPIFFLPWLVEIPAVVYLGLWFVSQLANGVFSILIDVQAMGGVAWWAHIGGFVAGLVLAPLFRQRRYVRRYYLDEYYPW